MVVVRSSRIICSLTEKFRYGFQSRPAEAAILDEVEVRQLTIEDLAGFMKLTVSGPVFLAFLFSETFLGGKKN